MISIRQKGVMRVTVFFLLLALGPFFQETWGATLGELLVSEGFTPAKVTVRDDGRMSVVVKINGRDLKLMVDSGAPTTLLSRQAAERCGVTMEKEMGPSRGINGIADPHVGLAKIDSFSIADVELTPSPVVISNFRFPYLFGNDFDGLLGLATLKFNGAVLGCGRMPFLYFHPMRPAPYGFSKRAAEMGFREVSMTVERGHYLVPAQINGVAGRAILDTGAGNTVVNLDFVRNHHIAVLPGRKIVSSGMDGKMAYGKAVKLQSFAIAGFLFSTPALAAMPLAIFDGGGKPGQPVDALVARDLLGTRAAIIDFGNDRMYFLDSKP